MAGLEAALREVRGRVEQRRADITSQTSQGAVVKALMEARRRGDIDGIHGRLGELLGLAGLQRGLQLGRAATNGWLACKEQECRASVLLQTLLRLAPHQSGSTRTPAGDLGAIAKEYDIAVSTSCPALDYIVVDTTSAAQRCVELLRQVGAAKRVGVERHDGAMCAAGRQLQVRWMACLPSLAFKGQHPQSSLRLPRALCSASWAWPPSSSWRSSSTWREWPRRRSSRPRVSGQRVHGGCWHTVQRMVCAAWPFVPP